MTSWENLHADRNRTCTLENSFCLRNANMFSLAFFFFFFGGGGGVALREIWINKFNLDLRVSYKKLQSTWSMHIALYMQKKITAGKGNRFSSYPPNKKKKRTRTLTCRSVILTTSFSFRQWQPPPRYCRIKTVDCPAVCKSVNPNCKTLLALVSFTVCQKQKQLIKSYILAENWYWSRNMESPS